MRRFWWPESLYEAKPYGALTLGLLLGVIPVARSLAVGSLELPFAVAVVLGCLTMVYGAVVMRWRHAYRRRSRWQRESGR